MPALYSARSGYEIINEVGIESIRAKSLRQTARLIQNADKMADQLEQFDFQVKSPRIEHERGGTVCIDFRGSEAVSKKLIERGFVIDWRPKCGIRVSPHFYNTDQECDRILEEIEAMLKQS